MEDIDNSHANKFKEITNVCIYDVRLILTSLPGFLYSEYTQAILFCFVFVLFQYHSLVKVMKFSVNVRILKFLFKETSDYLSRHFFSGATAPQWAMASSFTRFLDHTQRRTTVGRTPLDE